MIEMFNEFLSGLGRLDFWSSLILLSLLGVAASLIPFEQKLLMRSSARLVDSELESERLHKHTLNVVALFAVFWTIRFSIIMFCLYVLVETGNSPFTIATLLVGLLFLMMLIMVYRLIWDYVTTIAVCVEAGRHSYQMATLKKILNEAIEQGAEIKVTKIKIGEEDKKDD